MEYAKTPLRVNAIAPGGVDTAPDRNFQIRRRPRLRADGPLHRASGRMGSADDIAALFAFVASDEGRNIHGAILWSTAASPPADVLRAQDAGVDARASARRRRTP